MCFFFFFSFLNFILVHYSVNFYHVKCRIGNPSWKQRCSKLVLGIPEAATLLNRVMTSFVKNAKVFKNPLKEVDRRSRSSSKVDIREKKESDAPKLHDIDHLYTVLHGIEEAYTDDLEKGYLVVNENHISNFEILLQSPHISQSTLDKIFVLALIIPDKDKHYDLVEKVIMHGANVNWSSYYGSGQRLQHYASRFGHIKCLELLLRYNANASLTDEEGRTALHLAAIFQNIAVVKLLLQNGVNHDWEDHYGRTALHAAIESIDGIESEVLGDKNSRVLFAPFFRNDR